MQKQPGGLLESLEGLAQESRVVGDEWREGIQGHVVEINPLGSLGRSQKGISAIPVAKHAGPSQHLHGKGLDMAMIAGV